MRCSTDLRKRVIDFVASGQSKAEAARKFEVSVSSFDRWTKSKNGISYKKPGPKGPTKLNMKLLEEDIEQNKDSTYAERAKRLGVSRSSIWYHFKKRKVSRKKNDGLCGEKNYRNKKVPAFEEAL